MDLQPLIQSLLEHKWIPAAAIVVGILIRYFKDDTLGPAIPARWRPWAAIVLGVLSGVLAKLVQGSAAGAPTWTEAILGGLGSASIAMSTHAAVITSLFKGKEIPIPGLMKKPGPPKESGPAVIDIEKTELDKSDPPEPPPAA